MQKTRENALFTLSMHVHVHCVSFKDFFLMSFSYTFIFFLFLFYTYLNLISNYSQWFLSNIILYKSNAYFILKLHYILENQILQKIWTIQKYRLSLVPKSLYFWSFTAHVPRINKFINFANHATVEDLRRINNKMKLKRNETK